MPPAVPPIAKAGLIEKSIASGEVKGDSEVLQKVFYEALKKDEIGLECAKLGNLYEKDQLVPVMQKRCEQNLVKHHVGGAMEHVVVEVGMALRENGSMSSSLKGASTTYTMKESASSSLRVDRDDVIQMGLGRKRMSVVDDGWASMGLLTPSSKKASKVMFPKAVELEKEPRFTEIEIEYTTVKQEKRFKSAVKSCPPSKACSLRFVKGVMVVKAELPMVEVEVEKAGEVEMVRDEYM